MSLTFEKKKNGLVAVPGRQLQQIGKLYYRSQMLCGGIAGFVVDGSSGVSRLIYTKGFMGFPFVCVDNRKDGRSVWEAGKGWL